MLDPQIVLFDEPDSGLDPVRTALLCELIQEMHAENGGAYVVITHDIMSARRVADYIAVLWKGRIVESGPASELFNSDNQFVRQFLSGEARARSGWSSAPPDTTPGTTCIRATLRAGTRTLVAATGIGAVVVFVFLTAILPAPSGTPAHDAILFNLAIFVPYMALALEWERSTGAACWRGGSTG